MSEVMKVGPLYLTIGPHVTKWVARHLPPSEGIDSAEAFGPNVAIGFVRDGRPVVGVVYNWFRNLQHGNDVRLTIVATSNRWAYPEVVKAILALPFKQYGCERITAVIREGNERSLRLTKKVGFRREGILRRGYNGKTNAIVMGMLRSEFEKKYEGTNG